MKTINYVTTNIDKFNRAQAGLNQFGIQLVHAPLEVQEPQSTSGEEIVRHKVQQAYEHFKQPVLANDDTWLVPALRGFPSTDMKMCNEYLIADDWLRLMGGIEDRRVFLYSYFAYHDGERIHTIFSKDENYFLTEVRGEHPNAPCLQVIARAGSDKSLAEQISLKINDQQNNFEFWQSLSDVMLFY